jgi:hypothetical protein
MCDVHRGTTSTLDPTLADVWVLQLKTLRTADWMPNICDICDEIFAILLSFERSALRCASGGVR